MPDATLRARGVLALWLGTTALLALLFLLRVDPLRGFLLRIVWACLLAASVSLAALGAGTVTRSVLLRCWTGAWTLALPECGLLGRLVCGLPMFGSICFAVGWVSTARAPLGIALATFALLGVGALWSRLRGDPARAQSLRANCSERATCGDWPRAAACWAVLGIALGSAAVVAQLPPFALDEVAYHLAVPKAWVVEGRVFELPLNSHSYFPFGVEAAALPLLALAGDMGAVAFHVVVFWTFLAALLLCFGWLSEAVAATDALLALTLIATTPALLLVSGTGSLEAPFLALALTLMRSLDRATRADASDRAALADVTLAVAAGTATKYTWAAVLVCGFAAAASCAFRDGARLRRIAIAGVAGVTLGSVFFIRNWIWLRNPVAPFLEASAPHVSEFNQGAGVLGRIANYIYDPLMVDESLGAGLIGPSLGFVFVRSALARSSFRHALGALCVMMLVALGFAGAAGRILLPFGVIAGALSYAALAQRLEGQPRARAWSGACVLGVALLQLSFVVTAVAQYQPLSTLGRVDDAALARSRPLYPAIRWIDRNLSDGSLALVLGIQESYWFSHRVRAGGNFDGPRIANYLRAESPLALHRKLRTAGFTHIALYPRRILVGSSASAGRRVESETTLDAATAELLQRMLGSYASQIGSGEGAVLLELAP